jgi:cyclopropane-fatty-acyl-phospholipid synthase
MNDRGAAREPFVMAVEARNAWRRLWPPTIVYGAASATLLLFAVNRHGLVACLPWLAAGAVLWTWVEYLGHRIALHGVSPESPGPWWRFLHRRFVHLHWHHHAEPWKGRHVSASLGDTAAVVLALAVLASVLPQPAGFVAFASFLLSYVAEEWVHLSVHFASWRGRYFRNIRRRHLYHHGSRVGTFAFGLTSGLWDRVYGTHVPRLVFRRAFASSSSSVLLLAPTRTPGRLHVAGSAPGHQPAPRGLR